MTDINEARTAANALSWLAVQFRDRANDDGELTSRIDAEQVETAQKVFGELVELLDNVSAALEHVVLAHGASMTDSDRITRGCLADAAREICDALLRGDEQDDNPFHHESPEGRAWDLPDSDWVALAKDAGYDGSPGGEREWCVGNGMWPR